MNKNSRHIIWAVLLALPIFLNGQSGAGTVLSDKDQQRFDTYFYEAQRLKQIERWDEAMENFLACEKLDPQNAAVLFEIGKLYKRKGKPTESLTYLEKAYKITPNNHWMAVELATHYKDLGMYAEAIAVNEKLLQANPGNLSCLYELAQLYFSQGELKKCIATLNEIELQVGINQELSEQKKDIYLMQDDVVGAEGELLKLVDAFPANIEFRGVLAQFYISTQQIDKGIAQYELMISQNPTDPRAHLDLANIYQQQGNFAKSYTHLKVALASPALPVDSKIQVLFSIYQVSERDAEMRAMGYELIEISIIATPTEPKLYAMKADYLARDNRLAESRNNLRKATRLGANQMQIWSQLLLMDADLNLNDSLAADGEAFIELYPNQPMGYLMGGTGYLLINKYPKGVELLEAGLDFVIENPELEEQFYISLADGYHRMENHQKSDSYFEKALEINAQNPTVLNNYAYYLSIRGTQLDKALEMTELCNRLAPNNDVFLDTWAWVLYQKGNYALALEKVEQAVALGGAESGEVLAHFGDILYKLGRQVEAVNKWKEAATKSDAPKGIDKKIKEGKLYE